MKSFYAALLLAFTISTSFAQTNYFQKTYGGGDSWDHLNTNCIDLTTDGGYVMSGGTWWDIFLSKMDENGDIVWSKTYPPCSTFFQV